MFRIDMPSPLLFQFTKGYPRLRNDFRYSRDRWKSGTEGSQSSRSLQAEFTTPTRIQLLKDDIARNVLQVDEVGGESIKDGPDSSWGYEDVTLFPCSLWLRLCDAWGKVACLEGSQPFARARALHLVSIRLILHAPSTNLVRILIIACRML